MNMTRRLIMMTLTIIPFLTAPAQEHEPLDSLIGFPPESLDADMHKLLEGWHAQHFFSTEAHCIDEEENPYFPDTVYKARMQRMATVVPMTYNAHVRKCIDLYTGRLRKNLRYIMGMADFYFPMIEQKLDAHQLPLELKYLTIVESALNPFAQSRRGAIGIWQFMLPTGRIQGLEINSLIDERLDPERATDAACLYFKQMYDLYEDWYLVLAAYNCGPGAVNRAIKRAGGKMDFWKIFPYLPRDTRSYVPLYIAIAYVMTHHCEHNICPVRADFSVATDTIMVERALHFDQVAEILQMDKEAIRFYNPQYKREIIPGNVRPSVLRLPVERTFAFIEREDTLYTHRREELLAHCTPVDAGVPENRKQRITHTVKADENVYTIANLYGVTAQELRKWNGLSGSRVAKGRNLRIHIDNGGLTYSAAKASAAAASNTQPAVPASTSAGRSTTTGEASTATSYVSYTVKSGDSLYAISKKYPGMTPEMIQQANGLTTTVLRPGQVLKIPQG
jgi:membrane-bound lytic murein transglycosylase D